MDKFQFYQNQVRKPPIQNEVMRKKFRWGMDHLFLSVSRHSLGVAVQRYEITSPKIIFIKLVDNQNDSMLNLSQVQDI